MKSALPKIIGATTLALGAQMAQAGEFIDQPIEITLTEKQIKELCIKTQNNSHAIVNRSEVCEISTDNGKTWMLLTAALAASLLGAGYSQRKKIQPYMVRFLNRKKKERNIMDGPEPIVIEAKTLQETPVSSISAAEAKTNLISRFKSILPKKQKPGSSWLETTEITVDDVNAVIREEQDKNMQKLKDMFDKGFSNKDDMLTFFREGDIILDDGTYSIAHQRQIRDWFRLIKSEGAISSLETSAINTVATTPSGVEHARLETLTEVHPDPVLLVDQIRLGEPPFSVSWVTYVTGEEGGEPFSPSEISGMIDSMDETLRWSNFEFTIKWDRILAKWLSDGGKKFMQDYVSISSDANGTTLIVLDGVSSWTAGATEQYVAEIGTALQHTSLSDFIDDPDSCLTNDDFEDVATTVGRASIKNNRMSFEKIGDVGVVVFDKYGSIKYQNIGGWYIPVDWLESDDIIDPTIPGQAMDIIRIMQLHFPGQIKSPPGPLRKREFAKAFRNSTKQLQPRNEESAERDFEIMGMELAHDDVVLMATDGVFDNLTVEHIWRLIMDKTSSVDAVDTVLSQLDRIWTSKIGDFWSFKPDNIGLCVYRHITAHAPALTGPVDFVDLDI